MKDKEPSVPRKNIRFCREPSKQYLNMLEKYGNDPKSVAGWQAINEAGPLAQRGWSPTWDARDARVGSMILNRNKGDD